RQRLHHREPARPRGRRAHSAAARRAGVQAHGNSRHRFGLARRGPRGGGDAQGERRPPQRRGRDQEPAGAAAREHAARRSFLPRRLGAADGRRATQRPVHHDALRRGGGRRCDRGAAHRRRRGREPAGAARRARSGGGVASVSCPSCYVDVMRSLPHASLLLAVLALPAAAVTPWPSRELRDRQAGWVQGLAFTPDGQFLASADASGTVIVRMFPGPKVYATLNGSHFSKVAWSVDGRTLVGAGLDNLVYVWRQPFMDDPRTLPYDGPVNAVSVSPDGVILAAGGGDHAIRRWRMPTMEELAPLKGHSDDVFTVRA